MSVLISHLFAAAQSGTGVSPVFPQPATPPQFSTRQRVLECGTSVPLCAKTLVSRPKACPKTVVFLLSSPLFLALFFTLFFLSTPNAAACGISWVMPSTPHAEDGSMRFQYWTQLGRVKISDTQVIQTGKSNSRQTLRQPLEIPIHIGFLPSSKYSSPLGYGFEFPLFDSRLVWMSDRKLRMHLPDGNVEQLTLDKNGGILRGANWLGRYDALKNQAILKASCNWEIVFHGNRIYSMRSPEGISLNVVRRPDGVMELQRSGSAIVTLSPDWDKISTRKFYRLKYADKRHLLRLGFRPILTQSKDEKTKEPLVTMVSALVSIETEGEKNRTL